MGGQNDVDRPWNQVRRNREAVIGADVSDEKLAAMLRRYVAMVEPVLEDPERWLGVDEPSAESPSSGPPSRSRQAARVLGRGVLGSTPPASDRWAALSPEQRVSWWVTRIGAIGGVPAAAPRAAGMLADRLPLQHALGAAASGLAVCAVAREYGRQDKADWVPLLATVLFARDLPADAGTGPDGQPDSDSDDPDTTDTDTETDDANGSGKGAVRTLWRLARTFSAVSSLFDDRPRGSTIARGVAKVPVVGIAGGWIDERGAIRKAAERTQDLVGAGTPS